MMKNKNYIYMILALIMVYGCLFLPVTSAHAQGDQRTRIWMDTANDELMIGNDPWPLVYNNYELGDGNYYLDSNITIYHEILITGDVTLDLYGNTITQGNASLPVISNYNCNMTLNDSSKGEGKITGSENSGIYMTGGTFTMNGGSITDNKALAYNITGGGVNLDGGTFTMNGGSITGNTAYLGGGVACSGEFIMKGGSITDNTAKIEGYDRGKGGGVYIGPNGKFIMKNGSIANNESEIAGGGVYAVSSMGVFELTGGKITKNKDTSENGNSGGIYFFMSDATKYPNFKVSGNPTVKDNINGDVHFMFPDGRIFINDSLTGGEIYVFKGAEYLVAKSSDGYKVTENDASKFFSNKDDTLIGSLSDDGKVVFKKNLKKATITLISEKPVYDGKSQDLTVKVTLGDDTLIENTDYTITWLKNGRQISSNKEAGEYTVQIQGKGDKYCQSVEKKFKVEQRPITIKAKNQTVEQNGSISSTTTDVEVTRGSLAPGHSIKAASLTASTATVTNSGKITLSSVIIQDGNGTDVTSNYKTTLQHGVLSVTGKESLPEQDTSAPEAKDNPAANGSAKNPDLQINSGLKGRQKGSFIILNWGKTEGATVFMIYGAYSGKDMKYQQTVSDSKATQTTLKKLNGKAINFKKKFKFYIIAYKEVDGKLIQVAKTITIHMVGKKNSRATNVKAIKCKKSYTLKQGELAKLKISFVRENKKKKLLSGYYGKKLRFKNTNKSIATVNQKGELFAKQVGTCAIYVYASNGISKKIKVTVKPVP